MVDEESGIRAHLKRADYTPSELRQEWQNSLALRKPGKGSTGRLLDELDLRSCSTNTGSENRDTPAGQCMGGGTVSCQTCRADYGLTGASKRACCGVFRLNIYFCACTSPMKLPICSSLLNLREEPSNCPLMTVAFCPATRHPIVVEVIKQST